MFLSMADSLVTTGRIKTQLLLTEFSEIGYMAGGKTLENYRFLEFFVILKLSCCVVLRYQCRSEARAPQSTMSLHQQPHETRLCVLLWDIVAIKDTKMKL